jgi:hypothetical protein
VVAAIQHSVVVSWLGKGILMVGPFGDWLRYSYDDPVVLVEEVGAGAPPWAPLLGCSLCPASRPRPFFSPPPSLPRNGDAAAVIMTACVA